jgi:hypothetical protein
VKSVNFLRIGRVEAKCLAKLRHGAIGGGARHDCRYEVARNAGAMLLVRQSSALGRKSVISVRRRSWSWWLRSGKGLVFVRERGELANPRQGGLAATSLDVSRAAQHHRASHVNHAGALQAPTTPEAAHASAMAAASNEDDAPAIAPDAARLQRIASKGESSAARDSEEEDDDDDDDDDDEEPDEEPKLKYSRLTANLGPVYRNGDATSTFMVAGDKMVRRSCSQASSRHPSQSTC